MTTLYDDLAPVYEAMYQTFIDYQDEYDFYSAILKKYAKQEVLEIGSGTGNLAQPFLDGGFDYVGLDFSENMIKIAQSKTPEAAFVQGDMRGFLLKKPMESIIITARTVSYLVENKDIRASLSSIYENMELGGILCFDFIDANPFIPLMLRQPEFEHRAAYQNMHYVRKSFWNPVLHNGMDFRWKSVFYKEVDGTLVEIGVDDSVVRSFMVNEMEIFLALHGFKVLEMIERPAYAFPTQVVVAEKI